MVQTRFGKSVPLCWQCSEELLERAYDIEVYGSNDGNPFLQREITEIRDSVKKLKKMVKKTLKPKKTIKK